MLSYLQEQLREAKSQISMHRDLSYQSLKQTLASKIDYFNFKGLSKTKLNLQPTGIARDSTLSSYKQSHQMNLMV